jgi:hypothetical protein
MKLKPQLRDHCDDRAQRRPIFTLQVRPEPGVDAIRALRAALKNMLRRYGLRCLSVQQRGHD